MVYYFFRFNFAGVDTACSTAKIQTVAVAVAISNNVFRYACLHTKTKKVKWVPIHIKYYNILLYTHMHII